MNELDKKIAVLTDLMVKIRDNVSKNKGYCTLRDLAEFIIRNGYFKKVIAPTEDRNCDKDWFNETI